MDVNRFKDSIKADIKAELRPRKLLRTAFVPQTKGLLTPIKEVFQIFVTLIAQMFVQAKLITKDHPSIRGDVHGFGAIWLMIIDASANLKFKRENMYQLVIFYGVVGMLVFGILGMVTFLMHVGMGHAHAQTTPDPGTLFTETSTSDNAPTWIGNLFDYNSAGTAVGLATVLGPMLKIYNTGLLALGTTFALYQILHLFMESAHHGKFGGKNYSDLYAPLRLVIGIGLLVPMSNGYNSAEIIAITVAKWGSGLASNVWSQALTSMSASSTQMTSMPVSDVNSDLQQLIVDVTCTVAYRSAKGNTATWDFSAMTTDAGSAYVINFGKNNSDSYCGSLTIPKETVLGTHTLYDAFVNQILPNVHTVADDIYKVSGGGAQATPQDPTQNPLSATCSGTCMSDWNTFLSAQDASVQTADSTIGTAYIAKIGSPDFSTYKDWTTAGFLFLKLSQQSGQLYQMQNAQLGIALPDNDVMSTFSATPPNCDEFFMSFHQICSSDGKTIGAATSMAAMDVNQGALDDGYSAVSFTANSMGGSGGGGKLSGALQGPFASLSAGLLNIACTSGAGCTSTSFGHSIMGIIGLGNLLLNVSSMLIVSGGLIGLSVAGTVIGQIVAGLGIAMFPLGVSLAIMLPLLPAARFLFGIFTWILTLFEAMVAMPLVALVSMEFSGEGLIAHGKQGWFVLLQMMLRPVLMIFGLIGAFMVFDTLSGFITQSVFGALFNLPSNYNVTNATTVAQAMQNMTRTTILTSFLTIIGFLYFYCVTLYALANICFNMINSIPDRILSTWVGTFGGGMSATGADEGALAQTASGAGSMGLGMVQGGSALAVQGGSAVKGFINSNADRQAATQEQQKQITAQRDEYSAGKTMDEIQTDATQENITRDRNAYSAGNTMDQIQADAYNESRGRYSAGQTPNQIQADAYNESRDRYSAGQSADQVQSDAFSESRDRYSASKSGNDIQNDAYAENTARNTSTGATGNNLGQSFVDNNDNSPNSASNMGEAFKEKFDDSSKGKMGAAFEKSNSANIPKSE